LLGGEVMKNVSSDHVVRRRGDEKVSGDHVVWKRGDKKF
jgi:hypothetical protein